jgi:hypothetical protein
MFIQLTNGQGRGRWGGTETGEVGSRSWSRTRRAGRGLGRAGVTADGEVVVPGPFPSAEGRRGGNHCWMERHPTTRRSSEQIGDRCTRHSMVKK